METLTIARDDVMLCIKGSCDVCLVQKMIRSKTKRSRFNILKGQPGSKSNDKENASNTNAIKTRIFMDLNPKQ